MNAPEIEYNTSHLRLEEILRTIDRPGDFVASGRLESIPPQVRVKGVGKIAYPILERQVEDLISVAERAPYGRGPDTITDRSVRDCWQIDANDLELSGTRWDATLSRILDLVAKGLGLPRSGINAKPYKLLVYEEGGFFAEHRDTEKEDRMVATLVVSLPVEGEGGEIVVRHGQEEVTIDLCVDDLGELPYAVFYADCRHRTKRVVKGNRASLVFNVIAEQGAPKSTPDYSRQVRETAEVLQALAEQQWEEGDPSKLVWLLDHAYSLDGLSFEGLKGVDRALAETLRSAARRKGCEVCLGTLRIREEGASESDYHDHGKRERDVTDEDYSIFEMYDVTAWFTPKTCGGSGLLAGGTQIPVEDGEALPRGALDGLEPYRKTLLEATGNSGVTLSRIYQVAAITVWPRARTFDILAGRRIQDAASFALRKLERHSDPSERRIMAADYVSRLIEAWHAADRAIISRSDSIMDGKGAAVRRALKLLSTAGDPALTARFLNVVGRRDYHQDLNEPLVAALRTIRPEDLSEFLRNFFRAHANHGLEGPFGLLACLAQASGFEANTVRWNVLRREASTAYRRVNSRLKEIAEHPQPAWWDDLVLDGGAIFALLWAGQLLGLRQETDHTAALVRKLSHHANPCRDVPKALRRLRPASVEEGDSAAQLMLWQHSADHLLARSSVPPPGPDNWSTEAPGGCDCAECKRLASFCKSATERVVRFKRPWDVRSHLEDVIGWESVFIDCKTEQQGVSQTLVCTKTDEVHKKRENRYTGDMEAMRMLVECVPTEATDESRDVLRRLRRALALSA
ncbi:MAG: 2OG-Fe(II) oxygenase [Bryobacterales bacterium]|nr:2OG-Fe(II) oxygenase [Bryobacterales bacterium]